MEENPTVHTSGSKRECDRIRALLACGVNTPNRFGNTPLHKAARNNDLKKLHLFLGLGAGVDKKDSCGQTALHCACYCYDDNEDILQALFDAGANIEEPDENGYRPLHKASHWGREKIIRLLLERGANPYARDKYGDAPIHRVFPFQYKKVLLCFVINAALVRQGRGEYEKTVTEAERLLLTRNRLGILAGETEWDSNNYLVSKRDSARSPAALLRKKRILEIFSEEFERELEKRLQEQASTQETTLDRV